MRCAAAEIKDLKAKLELANIEVTATEQACWKCCSRNAWGDGEYDHGCAHGEARAKIRALKADNLSLVNDLEAEGVVNDAFKSELAIARRLLFLGHGCEAKYGDDGEMQCNHHPHIDFKRMPLAQIEDLSQKHTWDRLVQRNLNRTLLCGCVTCVCEDPVQCHGCGAKFCDEHARESRAKGTP